MRLAEKYRPKGFDEVVGQDKAVAQLRRLVERGEVCYWLSGPSGSGKTTLARIVAHTHCGPEGVTELDCADEVNTEQLERIDSALAFRPLWGGSEKRAWIINEAHGLRGAAIRRLLGILERVARDPESRVLVIFTTTREGEESIFGDQIDAGPLLSRCASVKLTNQGLAKAGAALVQRIAQTEGLDGQPIEAYIKLMQRPDVKNNIRAALSLVESGVMVKGGA